MDYAALIARVFEDLEDDRLEKAVMGCLRLARHTQDYFNATIFLNELCFDPEHARRVFREDTVKLNGEARKLLWQRARDVWLAGRTLPYALNNDDEQEEAVTLGAGELDSAIAELERSIQDLAVPPGMGEFDTAAFTDRHARQKAALRLEIRAFQTTRARVKARCLSYAIGLEKQLQAQRKPELFLHKVQTEVNNYFNARSEDVYTKLYKAAQLADSNDRELSASLRSSEPGGRIQKQ
jgi:hypothetical protein